MSKPNIFEYATSELSQDAFLCWLLAWADHEHASKDKHLHDAGTGFVHSVMKKFGIPTHEDIEIKGIWRQWSSIDVLAEISQGGKQYVLIIEDKTETSMHGNQLQRYKSAAEKEYPSTEWTVLPLYLKTGVISRGQEAEEADYKVYSGKELLAVLDGKANQIDNDVFKDFYKFLKDKVGRFDSFQTKKVDEWVKEYDAWQGFFSALKEAMKSHDEEVGWQYDANASGGELIAHWGWDWDDVRYNGKYNVYLQIIKKAADDRFFLAFKVTDVPEEERYDVRWDLCQRVRDGSKSKGWDCVDKPERFGNGNSMVFCQTHDNDCWLAKGADGRLDMEKTIENLKVAKDILHDCVPTI